jgi:peptidyl-prolyl cis-trans isomerase SurA
LVDGVKAVVNDKVITYAEIQDFAMPAIDALRRQYAATPDSPEFQQRLNDALTNSLELLIERQLILHYFDTGGYHLPDSAVDELVDERIRERFGDRITLMKTLQAEGQTFEQFRKDVRNQYVEYELRRRNVAEGIVVSPFQVETYYQAHQDDYKVEEEVKLRLIVLNKPSADDTNTAAQALDLRQKIKDGASFAEVATNYSQGSEAAQGGEKDWTARSALRKELADVAFTLSPGDLSDVIETPEACYLMLVEDRHASHVKPLAEIREDIEKNLRAQKHDQLEKQWIESLRKKTFIRIFA